jgi:hypothetical protein
MILTSWEITEVLELWRVLLTIVGLPLYALYWFKDGIYLKTCVEDRSILTSATGFLAVAIFRPGLVSLVLMIRFWHDFFV